MDKFKTQVFVPKDYVDSCLPAKVNTSGVAAFDPKTLLKALDSSLSDLLRHRRKIQSKIDDLEDEAMASESARLRKLSDLTATMEDVQASFLSLEAHLGEVGKTAIRIGEQLETIDKQRSRAAEARDLIQFYLDFNRESPSLLDSFKQSSADAEAQTAVISRRLTAIAKEIDVPGTEMARVNIERFSELFERELLERFDHAYRENSVEKMNPCAKILSDLNGGGSCIQAYVNQHEFFLFQPTDHGVISSGTHAIELDRGLERLYSKVRQICPKEWEMISAIFSNAVMVMRTFIQRIFAQSIQAEMERVFNDAAEESDLHYLSVMAVTHTATAELVKDLQKFDKQIIGAKTKEEGISATLERCFDDIFVPYVDGDRYLTMENESFTSMMKELISVFTNYVVLRKRLKQKGVRVGNVGTYLSGKDPTSTVAGQVGQLLNSFGVDVARSPATPESTVPEEHGLPSLDTGIKLFQLHLDSVKRCQQMSKPADLPRNCNILFRSFVETFGKEYLLASLNMAVEDHQTPDQRSEPDLSCLELVQVTNDFLHMLQMHFQTAVIPTVLPSPTIHREVVIVKNDFISNVENSINNLLQKILEEIQGWTSTLLAKQRKADFRPKDDAVVAVTAVCHQVCEYMDKLYGQISASVSGANLELLLAEVGTCIHTQLLGHLKKYTFSHTGAQVLEVDLNAYSEATRAWKIPTLTERFEILRDIGRVFTVPPEELPFLLNDGPLGRIEYALLQPFLVNRSDWSKVQKSDLFGRRRI
ncbi:exocyst complex component Sec10-like protein [Zopfochytrium polystomum]|nr:exocyst complex component Sec10-like protein [Zopfochytrium polystomum]